MPSNEKKKSGCLALLGKLFLALIAFSFVTSLFRSQDAPRDPGAPPGPRRQSSPSTSSSHSSQAPTTDFQNGASAGEALGREMAQQDGGRPYPKGVELMATTRMKEAKLGSKKEWQRGFIEGFTQGWDSVRGRRNAEAYTGLTWETAQTGALLYDIDERHRASLVIPDRDTGKIWVRYVENGSVEQKDLKSMSQFWFVRKEPPTAPELSKLQASELPKQVALKSDVLFELPEGKGAAAAPAGTRVDLVGLSKDTLRVRFVGAEKEIAVKDTNFEEEVQTSFARKQQRERQEIERLAAIEKAKREAKQAEAKALKAKIEADAGKEPDDTTARVLVRLYLEKKLHDPSSVKYESWSDVQYAEYRDGRYAWCITVDYRAKNAFGAFVRSQHTGYIRNERLISFE